MTDPVRSTDEEMNKLFLTASENYQNGLLDEAEAGFLQLLEFFPNAPLLHSHLGLVYYEQGCFDKSRDSFSAARELAPDDQDILFNLALSSRRTGDLQGAISSYKQVLRAEPRSVDALYNLAGCYRDKGQLQEAIQSYLQVLQLEPEHLSASNNLAYVYHKAGDMEQAAHYYSQVVHLEPGHPAAQHMLAAITGSGATDSPESYVQDIFDNYSENYEKSLVDDLEYCVPEKIRGLLQAGAGRKKSFAAGLDLGCGTGLGGEAIADMVETLDGIDLSEKMIGLAGAKGLYRHLYAGDISASLNEISKSYDFFLAADVFGYLGDLSGIFSLLQVRARKGALFCCSTESCEGSGYRLRQTGRFAHSPAYVEEIAGTKGWTVLAREATGLRKEKGIWVQGDIWIFKREP